MVTPAATSVPTSSTSVMALSVRPLPRSLRRSRASARRSRRRSCSWQAPDARRQGGDPERARDAGADPDAGADGAPRRGQGSGRGPRRRGGSARARRAGAAASSKTNAWAGARLVVSTSNDVRAAGARAQHGAPGRRAPSRPRRACTRCQALPARQARVVMSIRTLAETARGRCRRAGEEVARSARAPARRDRGPPSGTPVGGDGLASRSQHHRAEREVAEHLRRARVRGLELAVRLVARSRGRGAGSRPP